MVRIFRLTLVFVCLATIQVRADRVVLTSGKIVEGQIISRTASEVKIKCKSGGTITYTKTIPAAQVRRVERAENRSESETAETKLVARTRTDKASKLKSLLDSAAESWLEKDYRSASMSVTRLIRGASLSELDALNSQALAKLDMDIARLAASSRIASAIDGNKGTNINLKNVTDYEAETLVAMLDQAIEEALVFNPVEHEDDGGYLAFLLEQVRDVEWALQAAGMDEADDPIEDLLAEQNPPLKGPSPAGDTSKQLISKLLNGSTDYRGDPRDAKLMLRHVRTTMSLVHQKAKNDWSLRKDRRAKKQTAQMRIALGELAQQVQRAAGGRGNGSFQRRATTADRNMDRLQAQRQAKAQQAEKDRQAQQAKPRKREGAAGRFNPGRSARPRGR